MADLPQDPHATAVTPARFREHMEILRRRFHPVALSELTGASHGRRAPRLAVAVTFDDGYEDNLTEAKPVLEEYGVPATVFVTTGYLDTSREFWWDVLERLLLCPGELPSRVSLPIGEREFEFDLGPGARYPEVEALKYRCWNWRAEGDPTSRHALFRRLSDSLRPLRAATRERALDALTSWAGEKPSLRPGYRPLARNQLARLVEGRLVAIGSHSVTHPVLSRLSPDEQWREIGESKSDLERVLGEPVSGFAYPYGVIGKTAPLVRKAGFTYAVGTTAGLVFAGRRRFRLPRLYVGNWPGDEFEHRLRGFN